MHRSLTILTCPSCQHAGHITLLRVRGKWGCVRCYGTVDCVDCGKRLSNGAKHDLCRACRYPPRADKFCSCCGVKVNAKQNRSGVCRPCRCAMNRAGPVNQRRLAKLAASNRDPSLIARRLASYRPAPPVRKPAEPCQTPFERAMERVLQGAGISIVRPISKRIEPMFTLGGVSSI